MMLVPSIVKRSFKLVRAIITPRPQSITSAMDAANTAGMLSCASMEPSVYEYPSIFRRVHMEKPGEIEEETDIPEKGLAASFEKTGAPRPRYRIG